MQKLYADVAKALRSNKMAKIKIWPHEEICPNGVEIESLPDETICEAALRNNIKIEHACEMSCACTTCHCIIRKGFDSLDEASDMEEDLLDKAWGLEAESRLSCQVEISEFDLEIELPKYTINMVSENH
jgi:2Fe-2S ferredoxin